MKWDGDLDRFAQSAIDEGVTDTDVYAGLWTIPEALRTDIRRLLEEPLEKAFSIHDATASNDPASAVLDAFEKKSLEPFEVAQQKLGAFRRWARTIDQMESGAGPPEWSGDFQEFIDDYKSCDVSEETRLRNSIESAFFAEDYTPRPRQAISNLLTRLHSPVDAARFVPPRPRTEPPYQHGHIKKSVARTMREGPWKDLPGDD